MNVLLTPYAREDRNPDPLVSGRFFYNASDDFGRTDQLNFAAPSEDEAEYPGSGAYLKKGKVSRQDPMSHRIIEKRRRDRMNNCLADLSRLIPPEYMKKGRGRVEKTEIIEMAIRHLKYLDGRANAIDRQAGEEHFRAGYQEAIGEAVRFLVEVRGYSPADGLCVQMMSHMQRHVDAVTKGEVLPREKLRSHQNSSSETSSSSSHGFISKGVITQVPAPAPQSYEEPYPMDCDRDGYGMHSRLSSQTLNQGLSHSLSQGLSQSLNQNHQLTDGEIQDLEPVDGRRNPEPKLRAVRKPEHNEDYLHSYKFKNSIERRFSRSQDSEITEANDMPRPAHPQNKVYTHKRRKATKPVASTSTSNSGSTEETRDNSPQDTSSESPHHHHQYEKPPMQFVPIFALNTQGKYYVPLSVDYSCLAAHLGPYDKLDAQTMHMPSSLHPVTINVNFQPCMNFHVKRERSEEWPHQ